MSLADKFFEADLSAAEAEQLDAELLASPETAERLLARAEADYRATGLPEPVWPGPKRFKRGWMGGLGLLALGWLGLWAAHEKPAAWTEAREERSSFSEAQEAPAARAPKPAGSPALEPASASQSEPKLGAAPQRAPVGLAVSGQTGEAHVRVYDAQGACVRHLYDGPLDQGGRHMAWDGKLDDGRRAASGRYTIELISPGGASRQSVRL